MNMCERCKQQKRIEERQERERRESEKEEGREQGRSSEAFYPQQIESSIQFGRTFP